MKLQLALDDIAFDDAAALVEEVRDLVDIVEIGTPFLLEEGMRPVRVFKSRFPELQILADTKIMDAGAYEAGQAFAAGADYATVLGATDLLTVAGCLEAARRAERTLVVDMICVADPQGAIPRLEAAGVTALAVHTGVDQQAAGRTPLDDLKLFRALCRQSRIFVAGGISAATIGAYQAAGADVAIVGGGIRHAADPRRETAALRAIINAGVKE